MHHDSRIYVCNACVASLSNLARIEITHCHLAISEGDDQLIAFADVRNETYA